MSNVVPLRKPVAVSPNHPSLHTPKTVTLTRLEAELIASLLDTARNAPPAPKAVDAAVELLMGGRR